MKMKKLQQCLDLLYEMQNQSASVTMGNSEAEFKIDNFVSSHLIRGFGTDELRTQGCRCKTSS